MHQKCKRCAKLVRRSQATRETFSRVAILNIACHRAARHLSFRLVPSAKERALTDSFWKTAAASLPPTVRWRYAKLFEAADEFEQLLDFVLSKRGRAYSALASACRGVADGLRKSARRLDVKARRLTPTR
jgi:hypothetical protein